MYACYSPTSDAMLCGCAQVSILSESMVIIVIGYLLGIILPTRGGSVISWAIGDVGVEAEGLAMAGVLNLFLLPIIIFEAGWSMNHRAFVDLLLLGSSCAGCPCDGFIRSRLSDFWRSFNLKQCSGPPLSTTCIGVPHGYIAAV